MSWRKRGTRYLVSWRMEDGSQGGKTVDTPDEARDLAAEKRLEMRRGTWRGRQRGRLPFSTWAAEWWETWTADNPSPTTLAATDSWLRLHVRPWFTDRPIDKITPADVRRWQAQLAQNVGPSTLAHCRSLALRIFQYAMDEGAIDANPVHKVPPPKRRVDPERVFTEVRRRALIPEEAGRLLACFPLFWWDHVLTLLGTGLRFGELAGLRRRRVHLHRPMPVLEVGSTRYQAGRFGNGFKPRPKSDAGIRQVPLAPLVVEAIRRQLPPGSDPEDLVFTGPGGGPGRAGGPSVPQGTRTVLSRHNLHRTFQGAVAKLADPAVPVRPTARRVLQALRNGGPQRVDQLAAQLSVSGRRPIRPATVASALGELRAAGLATVDVDDLDVTLGRWSAVPTIRDPLLEAVDLHGAHYFRRRGTGASDPPPPDPLPPWEAYAEELVAVMDEVGCERAALLAQVDAGPLALFFAGSRPDRTSALILADTTAKFAATDDYPIGVPAVVAEALLAQVDQLWGTETLAEMLMPSRASDERFRRWFAKLQRTGASPRAAKALLRAAMQVDARPILPLIHAPTLVLHRRDAHFIPLEHARYLAEHIPHAKLVELPGADLSLMWETRELALDLIEEFLTGVRHVPPPRRVLATVLFTDIVGSTERARRLRDRRWRELLDYHDELADRLVEEASGRLVKTTGDGILATFDGPGRGIGCAAAFRDEARGIGLQLREGLHTGEVELRDGDVGGVAVHIAARVMDAARPGEILASRTVRDLVVGSDVVLEDRGMQRLKGVEGRWQLYAVARP